MKNRVTLLVISVAQIFVLSLYAQSDLEYQDVYNEYIEQKELPYIMEKFSVGDTLHIFSLDFKAEYVHPDTIWKKRVKRPKEGKHYILQYIWNGVPTEKNSKSGFPLYIQSINEINGAYNYKSYDNSNPDNSWLIVNDPVLSRDIKISTNNLIIKSPKLINEIRQRMTTDSIYYVFGTGKKEEYLGALKIQSVDYAIKVENTRYYGRVEVYVPNIPDAMIGFRKGKLEINNHRIISKQEYDAYWAQINRYKNFLSLVVVEGGIPDGMEYYFLSDTMALYRMRKSWDDGENIYYCYAYGQTYTFGQKHYSRGNLRLLSPVDSAYLLSMNSEGENYRIENAKKWDEKNAWLIERDEKWDKDTCIFATVKLDSDIKLIDRGGEEKYDYSAERPKKGTIVPVVYYGYDGNGLAVYRIFYKGEYYAIDRSGLNFKSTEEQAYLMRRGQQGYSERIIHAIAHDLAEALEDALEEEMNKYKNYNKKQIFYLGNETYDSGYGWDGVKIKFYNPYKKTIKYIDCTLTAYNYFGDPQCDYGGRSSKDIRCIGPIEHDEGASFSFDDVMNNKNGIIQYYRPTKITITFIDNSTVSFTGWVKIKPHSEE